MVVFHFIVGGLLVIYQNEIKTHKETRNKSYIYFMTNIYGARFFFFYFLKKCRRLRCTGLLRSSKLLHLDGNYLACFT